MELTVFFVSSAGFAARKSGEQRGQFQVDQV